MLQRLISYGEINDLGDSGILGMLEEIQARTSESEVTGMLLMTRRYFMQYLEGPRPAVNAAYGRIIADTRHRNPTLLEASDIDERLFSSWLMDYSRGNARLRQVLLNYTPTSHFVPSVLGSAAAVNLMSDIRALGLTGITPWRASQ